MCAQVAGNAFEGFGANASCYPVPYLTAAAAIVRACSPSPLRSCFEIVQAADFTVTAPRSRFTSRPTFNYLRSSSSNLLVWQYILTQGGTKDEVDRFCARLGESFTDARRSSARRGPSSPSKGCEGESGEAQKVAPQGKAAEGEQKAER